MTGFLNAAMECWRVRVPLALAGTRTCHNLWTHPQAAELTLRRQASVSCSHWPTVDGVREARRRVLSSR
jgi:hypothetical protein